MKQLEDVFPVSVVGSGKTLNEVTDHALERAARLFEMTVPEVKKRATITGSIDIGGHAGAVTATFQVPKTILKKVRIFKPVKNSTINHLSLFTNGGRAIFMNLPSIISTEANDIFVKLVTM